METSVCVWGGGGELCVVKSHPLNTLIEPNTQMSHAARRLNKHRAVNTTNARSGRSLAQSLAVSLNCSNERVRDMEREREREREPVTTGNKRG